MNLLIRPSLGLLVFFELTVGLLVLAGQIRTAASPPPPTPAVSGGSKVDPHPLDPLSPKEISLAVDLLRASPQVGKNAFFPLIALNEPLKSVVYEHKPAIRSRARRSLSSWTDRPAAPLKLSSI
jgi:Cu2+-containing amine oxidase